MTHNAIAQLSVALEMFKMVETRQMRIKVDARQAENIETLVPLAEGQKKVPRHNIFYTPLLSLNRQCQLVVLRLADADAETTSYGIFEYNLSAYATVEVEEVVTLLTSPSTRRYVPVAFDRAIKLIAESANRLQLVHAS